MMPDEPGDAGRTGNSGTTGRTGKTGKTGTTAYPPLSALHKLAVDVVYLAGAGIALVVEDYIVGTVEFFFGWNLVGYARHELLAGGMVAFGKAAQTFFEFEVYANNLVDFLVEAVFVGDGALEDDVGRLGMSLGKGYKVTPYPGMDERVEPGKLLAIVEDDIGQGPFVDGAVGMEDGVAEALAHLAEELGIEVIGCCHLVGYKTGYAQAAEAVEYGGFATADAAGKGYQCGMALAAIGGSGFGWGHRVRY